MRREDIPEEKTNIFKSMYLIVDTFLKNFFYGKKHRKLNENFEIIEQVLLHILLLEYFCQDLRYCASPQRNYLYSVPDKYIQCK